MTEEQRNEPATGDPRGTEDDPGKASAVRIAISPAIAQQLRSDGADSVIEMAKFQDDMDIPDESP
jgi:hypothetical protein